MIWHEIILLLDYVMLYNISWYDMIEGSLEVKLPTIMDKWKGRGGKSQGREQKKKEDQRKLRCPKRARHCGAKRVSKSKCTKHTRVGSLWKLWCRKSARRCGAKHVSKSKCAKHTILGPLLEVVMSKKRTLFWYEMRFQVKLYKAPHVRHFWKLRCQKSARPCGAKRVSKSKVLKLTGRSTFGSWDVEKVHAVVARSTFRSQNVQNTPAPDQFWQLRCRKSARRCGAKHISKSKV